MAKTKTHKVIAGNTLSGIAHKYGVSVNDIVKANSNLIKNPDVIQVGWVLTIPVYEPSENISKPSKNYETIGKQFETAIRNVQNLDSVKILKKMMEG